MGEKIGKVTKQSTHPLPFLEEIQVPILYVEEEPPFMPVFAVCQALGIPPDPHIRRWRRLLIWETARKLPFQTAKRGKRLVWCLSIAEIPILYGMFKWNLVSPSMRARIKQAAKEGVRLAGAAYQEMQSRYKSVRQMLFSFLTQNADLDGWFLRYRVKHADQLPAKELPALELLLAQGRAVYQGAVDIARKMLEDMGELPVIDALVIDRENTVIDSIAMPLFPIVSDEDLKRFAEQLAQIATWHRTMEAFGKNREA